MNQANNLISSRLAISSLIVALVAFPALVLADEPAQTISEPGFRPQSEYAAGFLDAVGSAKIAVLPTIVRRVERTAHSFESQEQIVSFLTESGITTAVTKSRRIDLRSLRRPSQWEIFEYGAESIAEKLEGYETGADYTLVMELLVPGDQAVFGIEVYILNKQGRSVFSFLLNSHHQIFADAKLAAGNSSETARNEMIKRATQVGLTALQEQIRDAKECAQRAPAGVPKAEIGTLHGFDAALLSGADGWGTLLGYSTFNGPNSTVSFTGTSSYPPRTGADEGNRVLKLELNVTSWGGVIHRFTNETATQWTPYDWRALDGFSFWFLGTNSGTEMFFDIFDNRKICSRMDDAERFRYRFWDDVAGWRLIKARFEDLTRWDVGNDPPNDGLGLDRAHGWGLGTLSTGGPLTLFIDEFRLLDDATTTTPPTAIRITHKLFIETRLSKDLSRIEASTQDDGRLVVEQILDLACECTRLTLDRGFSYFRMDARELLSNERARFRLTFYESRPTDVPVPELPDPFEAEEFSVDMSAAMPAEEFLKICQPE